jgi:hypothetical protein
LNGDHGIEIRLGRGDEAIDGGAVQRLEQQALALGGAADTTGGSHFGDLGLGLLLRQ